MYENIMSQLLMNRMGMNGQNLFNTHGSNRNMGMNGNPLFQMMYQNMMQGQNATTPNQIQGCASTSTNGIAQFSVNDSYAKGENLELKRCISYGEGIETNASSTEISLDPNHIYAISYNFSATLDGDTSCFSIVPSFNHTPITTATCTVGASCCTQIVTANASFLLDTRGNKGSCNLSFTYQTSDADQNEVVGLVSLHVLA